MEYRCKPNLHKNVRNLSSQEPLTIDHLIQRRDHLDTVLSKQSGKKRNIKTKYLLFCITCDKLN